MAGDRSPRPQKPPRPSGQLARRSSAQSFVLTKPAKVPAKVPVKVPVKVRLMQPRRSRVLPPLLSLALLITMGSTVVLGAWLAVMLIVNPGSVQGLAWLLPEWNRRPLSRYQSLAEIRSEARSTGLTVGTIIPLATAANRNADVLIPILKTPEEAPEEVPEKIIELRVYRPHSSNQSQLELIDSLNISGPQELLVLAPLSQTPSISGGTARSLPVSQVSVLSASSAPGIWLSLRGEWRRGSNRTSYGLIVRYDLTRQRLQSLLPWTSPIGADPKWQQVTGSDAPELVVNETVGLAPSFRFYQPVATGKPTEPIRLAAIALDPPALKQPAFVNGLRLAQAGLWASALPLLERAKQRGNWSAAAQAQLDVVAFHAAVTKAQADRNWANPNQAIAANLIDGRWGKALALLQTALSHGAELKDLLGGDIDRLAARVEMMLDLSPNQIDLQAWGTLAQFAQHGREPALRWLTDRNSGILVSSRSIDPRLQSVLDLLNRPLLVADHPSRIVGTALPIATPQAADWLWPQPQATLPPNQTWYQIRVSNFHDGRGWRRSSADLNLGAIGQAQQLWSALGLTTDPSIQLIRWDADNQPQTIEAVVKATQIQNGQISLLAAAPDPAIPPTRSIALAMTTATVYWLTPTRQTLSDLSQQQPVWTEMMLPTLQQALPEADLVSTQTAAAIPVQLQELTDNQQLDAIVTLPGQPRPVTLIFSDQGKLIYSEIGREAGQSLAAIADLGEGKTALLVERNQSYALQLWSGDRFE